MAIKTFYLLNTTATAPFWGGSIQDGGSAPAAALSVFGNTVGKSTVLYYRPQPGSSQALTTLSSPTSYIDGTSSPVKGTSATGSQCGDSFVTPTALTGTFAAGNWTINFGMRTNAATCTGRMRCQVWASTNQDGTGARKLTSTTLVGSIVTMSSTSATFTSTMTWAAPAITLAGEYLFFQHEWNVTTAGTSNSCAVRYYQSAGTIATTDFVASSPPIETKVKHAGVWKKPTATHVKHAGTWKVATTFVKHAGTWKQMT